jgi:hypothetical protein
MPSGPKKRRAAHDALGEGLMSRGRKVGIGLLVLLVLFLALVVVADRIGVGVAEDRIAAQAETAIKNEGGTVEGRPDVKIGGFPFLTQVLAGNYDEITIKANKPQTNGIKLENMTLVANDVEAATSDLINGRGPVTAHKLRGTGFITWDTVKSLVQLSGLPVPVDLSKLTITVVDDRIDLKLPLEISGFKLVLTAKGTVTIANGKVQLQLSDVGSEGGQLTGVAKQVFEANKDKLRATIPTPQMPYKLVINNVSSSAQGVTVTASAADVALVQ